MSKVLEYPHGMSVTVVDGIEKFDVFCNACGFTLESIYDSHFCEVIKENIKSPGVNNE